MVVFLERRDTPNIAVVYQPLSNVCPVELLIFYPPPPPPPPTSLLFFHILTFGLNFSYLPVNSYIMSLFKYLHVQVSKVWLAALVV